MLTEASDDNINLQWKVREPKPVGKGKVTVNKKEEIDEIRWEEDKNSPYKIM